VLERLAEHLADEYAPLLANWPLQERITFVTEVMHADGGFAEWEQKQGGYEIRDFNCLFHRLIDDGEDDVCEWHRTFLSRTLGTDVRIVPCADRTERCCRFLIEAVPAGVLHPISDKEPNAQPK
jgi:predicted ArsR family transcriptional regulator